MPNRLTAINQSWINDCIAEFPSGNGWQGARVALRTNGKVHWNHPDMAPVPTIAGVYVFLFPARFFAQSAQIPLFHKTEAGVTEILDFEINPQIIEYLNEQYAVVYAGKTTNLLARKQKHFRPSSRTTRQVHQALSAMMENDRLHSIKRFDEPDALAVLKAHAIFLYHEVPDATAGRSEAVVRDLLEITLMAQLAPPFNLKAER